MPRTKRTPEQAKAIGEKRRGVRKWRFTSKDGTIHSARWDQTAKTLTLWKLRSRERFQISGEDLARILIDKDFKDLLAGQSVMKFTEVNLEEP